MKKQTSGFTIIEVLIVLAIASLILMIVFLAVPVLQRTERNNERKHYAEFALSQLETYRGDTGHYPLDGVLGSIDHRCDYIRGYLVHDATAACNNDGSKKCVVVADKRYQICFHDRGASHGYLGPFKPGPYDELSIETGHFCNLDALDPHNIIESSGPVDTDTSRFVVWIRLENNNMYCVDNLK